MGSSTEVRHTKWNYIRYNSELQVVPQYEGLCKDLFRYRQNTIPNFILWNHNLAGGLKEDLRRIFWTMTFYNIKKSNFRLSPLEVGHWAAQTWPLSTISDKGMILNLLSFDLGDYEFKNWPERCCRDWFSWCEIIRVFKIWGAIVPTAPTLFRFR